MRFPDFIEQTWRTHGDTYAEAVANGESLPQPSKASLAEV